MTETYAMILTSNEVLAAEAQLKNDDHEEIMSNAKGLC